MVTAKLISIEKDIDKNDLYDFVVQFSENYFMPIGSTLVKNDQFGKTIIEVSSTLTYSIYQARFNRQVFTAKFLEGDETLVDFGDIFELGPIKEVEPIPPDPYMSQFKSAAEYIEFITKKNKDSKHKENIED